MQKYGVGPSLLTAQESGKLNMHRALELAWRLGGWVTADLVAGWIWPKTPSRIKLSERLLRRGVAEAFFLPRPLAGKRHAYAITRAGAAYLGDGHLDFPAGTGWGRIIGGKWFPPAQFAHDERAARFLVAQAGAGREVIFGPELARANPTTRKLPDGLMQAAGGQWGWVEAENARKSGPAMRHLAEEIITIAQGHGPWLNMPDTSERAHASWSVFVLPPEQQRDDRGHRLSHQQRIESAVARQHPVQPVKLRFFIEARPWVWTRVETIIEDQP